MNEKPIPKAIELAYAENRYQNPAHLIPGHGEDPLAMRFFDVVAGNPSYIALADGHTILNMLCVMAETCRRNYNQTPFIAIVGKHGNPCGAAIDWDSPNIALSKALYGNPTAAMGGELVTNFFLNDQLGQEAFAPEVDNIGRKNWGLDVILAPGFSEKTIDLMGKKEKRRLLANPHLANPFMPQEKQVVKVLRGGDQLIQGQPNFIFTPDKIVNWANGRPLEGVDFDSLIVAQVVAWFSSSNTIALAKDRMLIGLGCGQQDRIECARLCVDRAKRAGHDTCGAVFASDAFFPFAIGELSDITEIFAKINEGPVDAFDRIGIINLDPDQLGVEVIRRSDSDREIVKKLTDLWHVIARLDKREAAELLIDAGCIGGIVPRDGKKVAEVEALFRDSDLSVAFLPPEYRGFAKY